MKKKRILFNTGMVLLVGVLTLFIFHLIGGGTIWGRLAFRRSTNEYLQKKYPNLQYELGFIWRDFKPPNYYEVEIKPLNDAINFYVHETHASLADNYALAYWENYVNGECNKMLKYFSFNAHCESAISSFDKSPSYSQSFPDYEKIKGNFFKARDYMHIRIEFDRNYEPATDFKKLLELHDSLNNRQLVSDYVYLFKNYEFSIRKFDSIKTRADFKKQGRKIK